MVRKLIIVQLLVIAAFILASCTTGNDITGHYRYEKTIYQNPLSCYLITGDNAPDYIITENSITILHSDGTKQQLSINQEKSAVDKKTFNALFQPGMGMPDISYFKNRYQCTIDAQYRLFFMDNEIWFAQCPDNVMWSICQIVKIEDS